MTTIKTDATGVMIQLHAHRLIDGVLLYLKYLIMRQSRIVDVVIYMRHNVTALFSHSSTRQTRQSLAEISHPLLSDLLCAVQNWNIIMFPPRSSFHSDGTASLLTMTNTTAGSRTLLSRRWAVLCLGHLLVILFCGSIFVGKLPCNISNVCTLRRRSHI